MRSIFFEEVPSEAASVMLRVTDTSCTYACTIETKDPSVIEDWWQKLRGKKREWKKAMRIRLVKRIMMLRVLQNVGVCGHILNQDYLNACLACCFGPCAIMIDAKMLFYFEIGIWMYNVCVCVCVCVCIFVEPMLIIYVIILFGSLIIYI